MTKYIQAQNVSSGWLAALEHLLLCGEKDVNVIVQIEDVGEEELRIRQFLDEFLAEQNARKEGYYPVSTVANTLFPQAFYNPRRGEAVRRYLYEMAEQSFAIARRLPANQNGTYFQRMIAWSAKDKKLNQLEVIIKHLRGGLERGNSLSSAYEIGLSDVEETNLNTGEIRIYQPGHDGRLRGFPCLSHIRLTLSKGKLHMTALYRNQHFVQKAYGNYVGLGRLLLFLCQEVGCGVGELVCVASHADAELNLGKRAIIALVQRCKAASTVTQFEMFGKDA